MRASADLRAGDVGGLLAALIEVPSVNPAYDPTSSGENAFGDTVGALCSELGCEVTTAEVVDARRNVVAVLRAPERRTTLLIEGHLDTVGLPAGETSPVAVVEGGVVYGRGACDVKGSIAASLLALSELACERPRHVEVILLGAIDEEFRFRGITHFLEAGHRPDAAIVLEPTGLEVVAAHNGVLRIEVVIRGRAAHTSRPGEGRNAILDALVVAQEFESRALSEGIEVLTVTTIEGGRAINIVPDHCVLGIDIRTSPQTDPGDVLAAVESRLASLEGIAAEVHRVLLSDGGMHTDPAHPFVRTVLAAAGRAEPVAVPYGTDGSKLSRAGVPTVVYGPGSIANAHSDHESVAIADVEAAAAALVAITRALDEERG